MIRARSPFFYANFIFGWLAAVFGCIHWALNWDLYGSYPEGAEVFQTIDRLSPLALTLAGLFFGLLLCTCILEIRIWRGWEPSALETFKPGCTLLEVNRSAGQYVEVLVSHEDSSAETYLADHRELRQLQQAETMHLWVIGKHISRVRSLPASATSTTLRKMTALRMAPEGSWIEAIPLVTILLSVSCLLTGVGLRTMIVKDLMVSSRRRYFEAPELATSTGSNAFYIGLVALLLGLILFSVMCILWKRGWDAEIQSGI